MFFIQIFHFKYGHQDYIFSSCKVSQITLQNILLPTSIKQSPVLKGHLFPVLS